MVLRFYVSMNETLLVQIINSGAYLNKKVESCVLTQILFFSYQVKQVSFGSVFQSEINCSFIFKTGVKATNVFMVQLLLNSNFSDQCLTDFTT